VLTRRDFAFALAGAGLATASGRLATLRVLRMSGSSIAGPSAAGWVTDFLNAAYYARPPEERTLADLRLAWAILTTRWHRQGHRPLRARDLLAFHRAFGRRRLGGSPFGTLSHEVLLAGGHVLLGDWFRRSWDEPGRRGWGVVFEDEAERAAFRPELRLGRAPLGPLAPPSREQARQSWHTYAAVPVRSAVATAEALLDPPRWPDFGSALGRFTPVRSGPVEGQTFEIEIVAGPIPRAPILVRAYVTATRVLTDEQPDELAAFVETLERGLAAAREPEPRALPDGARPLLALELTAHRGHFMGAARSNLVLFEADGRAFLRDVGQWDRLGLALGLAYRHVGVRAQQAFWGGGLPEESLLHQLAAA
jgi:hypothetical protein